MKQGYFTFVLHSHLPYVRMAGRWPHGEEMIHEALAETYVPLLNALFDLKREGIEPRVTVGITPILLEQIADRDVREHFELYLQEEIEFARSDAERFEAKGMSTLGDLAEFYGQWYQGVKDSYEHRYGRDVVGAFRRLREDGNLDVITSAATHGYLPLFERDSSIHGQLSVGVETTRRHLGHAPYGIWLPECGYRPAYYREAAGESTYKPGLEDFLAELNLHYFFTDTHVVEGGKMVGKVVGDVHGPYGGVPERQLVVKPDDRPEATERTALRPYYVQATKVAVFGRDSRTGTQVWSAKSGYPGDFRYREFHRKDQTSGLQYWRVTGADVDLDRKDYYDPRAALAQTVAHADHFAALVAEIARGYAADHQRPALIVSAYDTELFGHWWFEGIEWVKQVLRRLAANEYVGLTTTNEYLEQFPPDEVLTLPESSWGAGGNHWTWQNPDTEWIWPLVHNAERRMEQLVATNPSAEGWRLKALNQVARELVLVQSSDWPFLISTGQAKEYATGRFQQHLARFNRLAMIVESGRFGSEEERFLDVTASLDNPFPTIDYRVFAEREKGKSG
ncbi:MAG TPA: 1,4-alpha-glucan branching protein domain-containing protein [Chloroflexota bacterium]|nr:1,4-alpha-glucan branching protein domain-containing protein [Chloroflexota bacterium]